MGTVQRRRVEGVSPSLVLVFPSLTLALSLSQVARRVGDCGERAQHPSAGHGDTVRCGHRQSLSLSLALFL